MRKKSKQFFSLFMMTLLLGSLFSSSAMAKGDRPEKLDSRSAFQTDAGIQSLTALTLKESLTPEDGGSWTSVYGNMTSGYTMLLSGTTDETVYLDVESLTASPALKDGNYPFYLDPVRVPAEFWTYWADLGVDENAAVETWEAVMWQIINGELPIFYLRVSSTGSQLIDGLAWQTQQAVLPARVSADYPLHTYNFEGLVGSENVVVGITYTRGVTPLLRIGGEEPEEIIIDGCGYVDVTIHLENVYNLYAVDLSLTFDKNYVEVVDRLTDEGVNPGVNLMPIAPWDDPTTAYTVRNLADNSAGTIRFIASLLNTQAPITGGMDVATIRLRAKDLGESKLSITGMMLSDRDGYLVGVPLTTPIEYPVTTQFTAAGGLNLGIIRLNPTTVRLSWPAKTTDEVETFTLHRSTLPYFTPGTSTVYQTITNNGTVATFDDPVLGNVDINYFYTMQITCGSGLVSPYAWQVGKFEYTLYETNTTDFTWIGFVLENPAILDSQDIADHVEDNIYSGQVLVKTISRWNANGQSTTTYNHTNGTSIFPVSVKYPYRIEIDIVEPVTTNNTVIWAQVGRLPVITENTYTLYETNTTDFSWILQPLDKVAISNTIQLADDIRANSNAPVNVSAIGRWNGTGQSVTSINTPIGGTTSFTTRFGYPYRIEVDVVSGSTVTWP